MASDDGNLNIYGRMHGIGLGPGSSNNWDDYPSIPQLTRVALGSIITPSAYKELHFHPDSFAGIYPLSQMGFKALVIFKISESNAPPAATEHAELTAVVKDIETVIVQDTRSAYCKIFELARAALKHNIQVSNRNRITGNTQDVESLFNMAFAFPVEQGDSESYAAKGFFPYFSLNHEALNESVFFFFHERLNRIVMVAAATRAHALNFMLKHGRRHAFDKLCAQCGRTGDLRKCSCCRMVRYCSTECQGEHWAKHRVECRSTAAHP